MPGPGYYNTVQSAFDVYEPNMYNEGSYFFQLNTSKKKPTAAFLSNINRDESIIPKHLLREKRPAPGSYNLPSAIKVESKPAEVQNFGTSGSRFTDVIFFFFT